MSKIIGEDHFYDFYKINSWNEQSREKIIKLPVSKHKNISEVKQKKYYLNIQTKMKIKEKTRWKQN